jgi:hypothetical protein
MTSLIDYKDLLWKYMNHVGEDEGTTFMLYAEDEFELAVGSRLRS